MGGIPNFFSTAHLMSATSCQWAGSTWATDTIAFGFAASGLRLYNTCSDLLYYSLKGSQTLTTADGFIAGCSALVITGDVPRFGGLTLMTTSSSSTARPRVSVEAWASA